MAKTTAKAPTKTEIFNSIADATGLSKKDVAAVFDALTAEVKKSLGNRGSGAFTIPGLLKIQRKRIPARKAEKNWLNPFTKEIQERPAKPASNKVKVLPLKGLKDMV